MEIPNELKSLYNHWKKHTVKPSRELDIKIDENIYKGMIEFSNERMNIWKKKTNELKPPYTSNSILNKYRFCNIYRELDRQTIFYHSLLKEYTRNFPLWLLNMMFCRFICNADTILRIGLLNFDKKHNQKIHSKLLALPSPKYGNAYIFPISAIQSSKYNTREKLFCYYLPSIVPSIAKVIEKFDDISVVSALEKILPLFGFNLKFHWTEVLIDIAYQYPQYVNLYKRFPIGPGSKPTMKKLNKEKDGEDVCLNLVHTVPSNFNYLTMNNIPIYLSAENWEGIGCEYRKYTNLKNGFGRKRIFKK
ncbi:MAG: nucleotide kinase domain-containing protein [Candidatus Dojkabacteria bacterium]